MWPVFNKQVKMEFRDKKECSSIAKKQLPQKSITFSFHLPAQSKNGTRTRFTVPTPSFILPQIRIIFFKYVCSRDLPEAFGGDEAANRKGDVLVIGAGVAGVSTAHALAGRGFRVAVVDAAAAAGEECRYRGREKEINKCKRSLFVQKKSWFLEKVFFKKQQHC